MPSFYPGVTFIFTWLTSFSSVAKVYTQVFKILFNQFYYSMIYILYKFILYPSKVYNLKTSIRNIYPCKHRHYQDTESFHHL